MFSFSLDEMRRAGRRSQARFYDVEAVDAAHRNLDAAYARLQAHMLLGMELIRARMPARDAAEPPEQPLQ